MSRKPSPTPTKTKSELDASSTSSSGIAGFFGFDRLETNFRTEVLAGVTTFVTMAYILAVNPDILSNAIFLQESGDLFGELVFATAISAAIATLIMGLYAKYPFALAPGMGINAYFAFSVVLGLGIDWRVALAAVFIEGLIFIVMSLSKIRSRIVAAIPDCLKHATASGIGLFIAYIALTSNSGIIVTSETTTTTLGNIAAPNTLMAIAGILITAAFVARRVKGALLIGIFATALLGWILGVAPWPQGIVGFPSFPVNIAGQAFVGLSQVFQNNIWNLLAVIFVFLFVDTFDTVGTLTGVGVKAGFVDEQGELPHAEKAFMADAVGTTAGAALGTSTVATYIESAAGVSEGGRSGLTAVVAAILFALAIFFTPLLSAIPPFATAPVLLIVGVLMAGSITEINWNDPAESIPSFLTILFIPLSFSIAEGLAVGFISYPLLKTFQGKAHETDFAVWILAAIFLLRFVFLALEIGA
ncbi:NCS2 family permease [Myxosarcina sp. GI1]|uniref:NCS2 family permease n=1 Tax=Myxosarcina sp. GI1 TaxID=1541065 RepID=UPI00068D19A6|nr:NCS2 family permease [Myxosarcina sp. GI1]